MIEEIYNKVEGCCYINSTSILNISYNNIPFSNLPEKSESDKTRPLKFTQLELEF